MSYEEYSPVSVLLPEESGLRREFLTPRPDLGDEEYAQYDQRTLFYDVFRRVEDPRRVVAIGPPPVNLAPELHALRISRAGRALRHRILWYRYFTVVELRLDRGAAPESAPELDFAFPSFAARVRVSPPGEEQAGAAPRRPERDGAGLHAAGPLAMMTLQKDNEIAWIEDWCRWHHRLHGVTRFHIYDNGSANLGPLQDALRRLGDEMDIVLIPWPYPYGPGPALWNRFAQMGAMNHYRLRFGRRDAWCLNMDVDEYLAACGGRSLREILAASARRGLVSVRVDSFMVPGHAAQRPAPQRRAWDYVWRERRTRSFEKCIFVPFRAAFCNVHYTYPGNRLLERCARWPGVGDRLFQFWYRKLPDRIEGMERDARWFRRAGAWLLRRVLSCTRRTRLHSPDELFYFHVRGLNTDWKPERRGGWVESFDPEIHVEDPRMRALAEQAGLAPPGAGAPKGGDASADGREGTRA